MTTPRTIELDLSRAFDAGFEVIGELAGGQAALAQSMTFDDQEQAYKQQHLAQIRMLPAIYQGPLLGTYLPAETLDRAQRAAAESAQVQFAAVAEFARTLNGFLERAMDGCRELFSTGRWRKGRTS